MKNNQTGELQEVRWDRLLRIKTAGRDDSSADQYRYPYEPRPIPFWNAWLDPDGSEKAIFCWTMAAARDGSGFFCPARPVAAPSASNMIRVFTKKLWKTKVPVYPPEDPPLSWPMPNIMPFPPPSTGSTFSTPFPWSFSRRSWPGSWTHIMRIHGLYCCFFIIPRTAISHI